MSVNNDKFLIEREDVVVAQNIAGTIVDRERRLSAVANVLAAKIAKRYFQDTEVDTESGMHNVAPILANIDISDIYIKDNYIDVRIYFNENELCVPKIHFDLDILPVAYMFIKVSEDISEAQVMGFVFPEDINTANNVNNYYFLNEDDLKSAYDMESRLITVEDDEYDSDFEKSVYDYLDGQDIDIKEFYKHLILSHSSRIYLQNASKAYYMYNLMFSEGNTQDENTEPTYDNVKTDENTTDSENNEVEAFELATEGNASDLLLETPSDEQTLELIDSGDSASILEETGDGSTLLENNDFAEVGLFNVQENSGMESMPDAESVTSIPGEEDEDEDDNIIEELPEEAPQESTDDNVEPVNELLEETVLDEMTPEEVQNDEVPQNIEEEQQIEDEFDELSKFDYSTEIEPSISSIEAGNIDDNVLTEEMLETADSMAQVDDTESKPHTENEEQLDNLFDGGHATVNTSKKKKSSVIPLLGFLAVVCALGYFGYTKYFTQMPDLKNKPETGAESTTSILQDKKQKTEDVAMPNETVENDVIPKQENEAVSDGIPAIEQNLNASIDVANLSVNWEVPLTYANNATAKRYFVKIGKVLQLNLKTELLPISSPPITNKITIELVFNSTTNKFVIDKMINSSGVAIVDKVIKDTVTRALNMNMSMNMSVFSNLQGNPILVIKL